MSGQGVEQSICCYVLKGNSLLFADERIKYHLLRQISQLQKQNKWEIYAFCLTDDEAYFITEARTAENVQGCLQSAADQVLDRLEMSICGRSSAGNRFGQSVPEVLHTLEEIVACCRQIHHLPLRKGYTNNLNDYWWSSYNTYVGVYNWEFTSIHSLLLYFSANQTEAVYKFRHFHRMDTAIYNNACCEET